MLFIIFLPVKGAANVILKYSYIHTIQSTPPQSENLNITHDSKYPTEVMSDNDDIEYTALRRDVILFKYIPLNNINNLAYTSNSKCANIGVVQFVEVGKLSSL